MKSALLVKVKRSNLIEREHSGFIVVVDKNENIISQVGNDNNQPFFIRSCAKPFQAVSIINSGAFEKFIFTIEELAICCSSHSGSDKHIGLVRRVLNKIGLKESNLLCGSHEPIDIESRNYLIRHFLKPSSIYNNCSGKHSGMLSVCINNNWSIDNYIDVNHPLQLEILKNLEKYCNYKNSEISFDGCSAPVHGMPLFKLGAGYLRLLSTQEGSLIKKAYKENPVIIGGEGRLDTVIMEVTGGRLISKTGADGLCVVVNTEEEKALVVKIMDANSLIRSLSTFESLKQLGWLTEKEMGNENIKNIMDTQIKTFNNIIAGNIETVFKL